MLPSADNGIKNRLTEPSAMIAQVKRLIAQGVEMDQIAPELSKQFYIDIDLLNAVLRVILTKVGYPLAENLVEPRRLELLTPCMPCRCSTS